jgi:hypothetical protein
VALDPSRLLEHVHGHLGWLSAAALVHPAIVLRDRDRRADVTVAVATALVTVAAAIGLVLYVAYRERLRQRIFLEAPAIGLLFERKEHLAFGAVLLAWAGCAAYFTARRAPEPLRRTLRTTALRAFLAAAALAVVVAALGTIVAVHASFG